MWNFCIVWSIQGKSKYQSTQFKHIEGQYYIGPIGANTNTFYCKQKLQEINFGDCLLKTKGALTLADSLQDEYKEFQVLNLGFNKIPSYDGFCIAAAKENKKIFESELQCIMGISAR